MLVTLRSGQPPGGEGARRKARDEQEAGRAEVRPANKRLQMVAAGCSASWPSARPSPRSPPAGGGGEERPRPEASGRHDAYGPASSCPPSKITDEKEAAKAAGCTSNPATRAAGTRRRTSRRATTRRTRRRAAPTSRWAQDGIYDARQHPAAGPARPHARARPHQRPVQAGHPKKVVDQLEELLPRAERRLPHAALREPDGDGLRGRRHRVGPLARLPDDERPGLRRAAHLPGALRRPRSRELIP